MMLILHVEDDLADIIAVRRAMLRLGLPPPVFAITAAEALAIARRVKPKLIIADLGLDCPLGGAKLIEALRSDQDLASVPIVILSGLDRDSDEERAKAKGADTYLVKPWDVDKLPELLAPVLEEHGLLPPNSRAAA